MQYIIAITPVNPLRAAASHRAEMVSELLFGETAQVIKEEEDFFYVKTTFDNYEGWVQKSQVTPIPARFFRKKIKGIATASRIIYVNESPMYIPAGAVVWHTKMFDAYTIKYGRVALNNRYTFTEENIRAVSKSFLNTSYVWGGRSSFGMDCSGFTQQVYRMLQVPLPRDAYQQAERGEAVGFLAEAKCGDLAFFNNNEARIVHVGILLDSKTIIHAAGKVRIDKIDTAGIINTDTGTRTHHLRMIQRIKNF